MARKCTVCLHQYRAEIDKALIFGASCSELARQYSLSSDALDRHKAKHLAKLLQEAAQVEYSQGVKQAIQERKTEVLDIRGQLVQINDATLTILHTAQEAKDPNLALRTIDRIQKQIELQAKLLGDLNEQQAVNVILSPEWVEIRTVILQALLPYPEAHRAVSQALNGVGE